MPRITVPITPGGPVDTFIGKVHDALVTERDVVFPMNRPLAHTAAARILAEIDPPIPTTAPKPDAATS